MVSQYEIENKGFAADDKAGREKKCQYAAQAYGILDGYDFNSWLYDALYSQFYRGFL